VVGTADKPSRRRPGIQLQVKTILNRVQEHAGFVFREVRLWSRQDEPERIEIRVRAHAGMSRRCSRCRRAAPGYDQLEERQWQHVPLWGIEVWFRYAPRRVECPEHGVVVEHLPWNEGKRPVTTALMGFLARWARRLSWRETAQVFQVSWEAVYRSVEWFVAWGLAQRELKGVESIGVDEIHWGHGLRASNFLTVIYQIDAHCRRLLFVGKGRSKRTLQQGLKVLDRFHIMMHLNQAVDEVRRAESARLRAAGTMGAQKLKRMRWTLLRRGSRVRGRARQKLKALLSSKLATARAWELKETFVHF
jgi:transposase